MSDKKYHRAFGVYGICLGDGKLLVINKNSGPYINRYDLPGGSLEEGESLSTAMKREFQEETGLKIEIEQNIGVIDFKVPWSWKDFTDVHHIAVYYTVNKIDGKLSIPKQFDGQDSLGAMWISENDVSSDNASPLVLKAFEWIRTKNLGIDVKTYKNWTVLK
ncbi:NUDIX hydrolase [Saliterribacillus persicus]|uniref:ADP-ribose pyrophosphatase YjhB (NUDIX family) n=1 Tax=Saliterribacillus persicus TaxID=930114 RepID=A0A368YDK1_9BACI|nr:NUDIX hydrolase [Saliterribacillus persicus]RCW76957.1 ADP-ribose pyrophosphatase YjhB (NUDIX family) [Saliterribacillus persicus]